MQSYIEDAVLGKCSHSSQKTSNKGKERPFDAIDGDSGHGGNQSTESPSKELVLSDPGTSGAGHFNLAVNDHIENDAPSFRNFLAPLSRNSQKISKKGKKRSFHVIDGDSKHGGNQPTQNPSNELLLYDPGTSAATDHVENHTPTFRNFLAPNSSSRTFQSIGTFTVQCASCFKWRIIPTKEKYEQIREKILEEPFVCQHAREWRPDIACEDPEDISQDGSRIWAIDKPNIAQPPSGWQRLLRIRGEGGTKFADVYYVAPSGKRLRSMVEVQKYLLEHPEYARHGVTLSQFSFQAPRPLQENYVKKRPARLTSSCDGGDLPLQGPPEPKEVNPLAWAAPDKEFIVGGQASSSPGHTLPASSPPKEPTPPIAVSPLKQMPIGSVPDKSKMKPEDKHPRSASSCELNASV